VFTLEDLGLSWRKAKADLYYGQAASLLAVAEYEEHLHANLSNLLERLNGSSEDWVSDEEFLGDWTLVPKSIASGDEAAKKDGAQSKKPDNGLIFSSPEQRWKHEHASDAKPTAQFRLMARCSMDLHVLSTLWILEVGHLFDARLSDCAYGNRLRRTADGKKPNWLSLGSFQPYAQRFIKWRDSGINAMQTALKAGKRIVAITGDVSKFYHQLDPSFMLDPAFIEGELGLTLDGSQERLHRLFIRALQAWAQATPLKNGLPVGLPASHVAANLALIGLDRAMREHVVPLYYGRYVDDIILVVEDTSGFGSKKAVWEWLFNHADDQLKWENEQEKSVAFTPAYLAQGKSRVHFKNDKNKIFILQAESGLALVDGIEHQICQRASEWRALPVLPKSADDALRDLVVAAQADGDAADNLRKADGLMLRRAAFAIKLRDYEAYERDLSPAAWKEHRSGFLNAVIEHVLVLPTFFDLATFLPRVIRLATACEDFEALRRVLDALEKLCKRLKDDCDYAIAGCEKKQPTSEKIRDRWHEQLSITLREAIIAAFPAQLTRKGRQDWDQHMRHRPADLCLKLHLDWPEAVTALQKHHARLFFRDLAHTPFRAMGLPAEVVARRGIPAKTRLVTCDPAEAVDLLSGETIVKGIAALGRWTKLRGLPAGLLFATRPFNLTELYLLHADARKQRGRDTLSQIVLATRGFELTPQQPCVDKNGVLQVPVAQPFLDPAIAVSSWKTSDASFAAAVKRMPDPDGRRYARLCRLVNELIRNPQNSRYLVLPELAMPARWFLRVAYKLKGRGISLITGVEYLHARRSRVRNQVWAALVHDALGFPSLTVYRQDKQRPALHEEAELHRLDGCKLQPEAAWPGGAPPVIQHGDLRFALLLCSELTNIKYRAALRGQIDALFVPEWNKDTDTFNALVESATLDIHAYIIQCNVRQYGDSRIRAPSKDSWRRDVLRVKGGLSDYCVIGRIDALALRRFQSGHRSPGGPFKPVPDGFEIAWERRVLPAGEME